MFEMIVAMTNSGMMGKGYGLPWPKNKDDMKWFNRKTKNKICVMGSKTFDSVLVEVGKTLPNRVSLVLTSNQKKYSRKPFKLYDIQTPGKMRYYMHYHEASLYPFMDVKKEHTYDLTGTLFSNLDDFVSQVKNSKVQSPYDFMICGGAATYKWFLDNQLISRIYLTRIEGVYPGDTMFPIESLGINWSLVTDFRINKGHVFTLDWAGYNPGLQIDWEELGFNTDFCKKAVHYELVSA